LSSFSNFVIRFYWDYHGVHPAGYREKQYFPFSNISDLIDQFNYVGYHDVCIYPGDYQLSPTVDNRCPTLQPPKGIRYVFGGHIYKNRTGIE